MISLAGDKELAFPQAKVWAKLSDLAFILDCLPKQGEVVSVTPDKAELVIQPQLAFIKGKLNLTISKYQEEPPNLSQLRLTTKGIGSTSEVLATFALKEEGGKTRLDWKVDIQQLGGLLKAVPSGFIKGAAQKEIGEILANVEKKLGESP
jgi:carbon monoxide dehydrogenase subunit G